MENREAKQADFVELTEDQLDHVSGGVATVVNGGEVAIKAAQRITHAVTEALKGVFIETPLTSN